MGQLLGWGCTGGVKYMYNSEVWGSLLKGILFISRVNVVNFKNMCVFFFYKYVTIFSN